MQSFSYDGRICQYNFAVTSPYMMQKGISLSSTPDDIRTLGRFLDIDGDSVLAGADLEPLDTLSTVDARKELQEAFDEYVLKASDGVTDITNDIAAIGINIKRVPSQEIYYTNEDVVIEAGNPSKPFNKGRPTTLLVDDGATVEIRGSLYGNLLILNPAGTISFVNMDCDQQDVVQGIFLAKDFSTHQLVYGDVYRTLANNGTTKPVWCTDGSLVVE